MIPFSTLAFLLPTSYACQRTVQHRREERQSGGAEHEACPSHMLGLLNRVSLGKPAPRFRRKPVGRTVARVSAEEHMVNYQAARALMGKGKSSAKKGAKKSAVKKAKPKK